MEIFRIFIPSQLLFYYSQGYFLTPYLEFRQYEIDSFPFEYEEDDFNHSLMMPTENLDEHKPGMNYQKEYNLRFDPTKLGRRSLKVNQIEYFDEISHYPLNQQQIDGQQIPDEVEIFDPNDLPTLQPGEETTNSIDNSIPSITPSLEIPTATTTLPFPLPTPELPPFQPDPPFPQFPPEPPQQLPPETVPFDPGLSTQVLIPFDPSISTQIPGQIPGFDIAVENFTGNGNDIIFGLGGGNEFVVSRPFNGSTNNVNFTIDNTIITKPKPQLTNTFSLIFNRIKNILFGQAITNLNTTYSSPSSKILSLFTVVKFENSPCSIKTFRNFDGICYNELECQKFGGVPMGQCAAGFGVCCIFKFKCNASTNQKVAYFESPNYPLPFYESKSCIFEMHLRKNVKQVLIEFISFETRRPVDGNCTEDQLIISGHSRNFHIPVLCGVNTGQHMYIDVESALDKKLLLTALSNSYGERAFNVKIAQLESNNAPDGCLQYYKESSGYIKSFNYDESSAIISSKIGSYLNNLNYAICIKRVQNMCTISYANEPNGIQFPFQMNNYDEYGNRIVPPGQAGADVTNCPDDYIAIGGLRLCGDKLNDARIVEDFLQNSVVTDTQKGPIIVFVRTNDRFVGRGFKLFYVQEYCPLILGR